MAIHTGKCPKCGKIMANVSVQAVSAQVLFGVRWDALSYQCPHCHTVLSVEIDPIALKNEIVREVFERLRKG
jgi:phage FluMu protein Com